MGPLSCALLLLGSFGTAVASDLGDGQVHLRHATLPALSALGAAPSAAGPGGDPFHSLHPVDTWVVAFAGPATEDVRERVAAAGGRIVGYIPSSSYLVRGGSATAQALAADSAARVWRVPPEWRVDPDLDLAALDSSPDPLVFVEIFAGESVDRAADAVRSVGAEVVRADASNGLRRLVVRTGSAWIPGIASLSEVEWVHDPPHVELRNDNVRWIIQSNDEVTMAAPLHDRGLLGEGQIIGHIDSAIQMNHCFFLDPAVPAAGPTHRKVVGRRTGLAPDLHGTHTAGTLAGEHWDGVSLEHRGMAPKARISHGNSAAVNREENGDPTHLLTLLVEAHADGARIHSNSWGDDRRTAYTAVCVDVDTFSRDHEDDLVLFAITNASQLRTPENAKNSLAVGATRAAPQQHEHRNGGAGPTVDGRRKPEVYAPGQSTISSNSAECAFVSLSGTSMACPAVAGGAALVREYYVRGFHPLGSPAPGNALMPTGALVKATIINSAVDMTGVPSYPSDLEGWGRILLDNALYFPEEERRLWIRDVRHDEGLGTGESRTWSIVVRDSEEPLDITMAFTDVPASLMAAVASVNDLDLEVEGPDGRFLGNQFDPDLGESIPGGTPDPLNNVERVRVPSPTPGTWAVRVVAASVPMGKQGFAVVANGGLSGRQIGEQTEPETPRHEPVLPISPGWRIDRVTPNPFRGESHIKFVVGERAPVTLHVYDLAGRRVRELFDRHVPPGEYNVRWDGTDDSGQQVVAGVYLLRLAGPGVARSARTVYLR